jgi:hypothetical protein
MGYAVMQNAADFSTVEGFLQSMKTLSQTIPVQTSISQREVYLAAVAHLRKGYASPSKMHLKLQSIDKEKDAAWNAQELAEKRLSALVDEIIESLFAESTQGTRMRGAA